MVRATVVMVGAVMVALATSVRCVTAVMHQQERQWHVKTELADTIRRNV